MKFQEGGIIGKVPKSISLWDIFKGALYEARGTIQNMEL